MSSLRPLADPLSRLAFRYDVVVVGSGYGGAIAAARLAQAGRSVCVLERGREWIAGELPTDETSLAAAVRTPVNPLGLVDANVQMDNDIDVVVGCGLGGTSLINAGISLRPEAVVFEQPEWPSAIRAAHADGSLARFYARAEEALGARRHDRIASVAKVRAHRALVESRGAPWGLVPLNVNHDPGASRFGVEQPACTLCGDCVAGCNVGAKNTLCTTYLPLAKRHGARIFTGAEVKRVAPAADGDGWLVEIVLHRDSLLSSRPASVRAARVVLAAGSLGSTEILLRSQSPELRFSPMLGARFSANADIMGLAYAGRTRTDAVGHGTTIAGERAGWPAGTTISSFGDYRRPGSTRMEERFLLLEGAIPTALATIVARGVGAHALLSGDLDDDQRMRVARDLVPFDSPGPHGALNHSLLYLACGHDGAGGRLVLADADGRVVVAWPGVAAEPAFEIIRREMEALARAGGALFVPNPRSTALGGERQMTVHPLGGCPMGDDADRGAVDDVGRVLRADGGVHEGLYVVDGAIVPRSLGVTPLLTIAALAERAASAIG